jgi:hypothetical protein
MMLLLALIVILFIAPEMRAIAKKREAEALLHESINQWPMKYRSAKARASASRELAILAHQHLAEERAHWPKQPELAEALLSPAERAALAREAAHADAMARNSGNIIEPAHSEIHEEYDEIIIQIMGEERALLKVDLEKTDFPVISDIDAIILAQRASFSEISIDPYSIIPLGFKYTANGSIIEQGASVVKSYPTLDDLLTEIERRQQSRP